MLRIYSSCFISRCIFTTFHMSLTHFSFPYSLSDFDRFSRACERGTSKVHLDMRWSSLWFEYCPSPHFKICNFFKDFPGIHSISGRSLNTGDLWRSWKRHLLAISFLVKPFIRLPTNNFKVDASKMPFREMQITIILCSWLRGEFIEKRRFGCHKLTWTEFVGRLCCETDRGTGKKCGFGLLQVSQCFHWNVDWI